MLEGLVDESGSFIRHELHHVGVSVQGVSHGQFLRELLLLVGITRLHKHVEAFLELVCVNEVQLLGIHSAEIGIFQRHHDVLITTGEYTVCCR